MAGGHQCRSCCLPSQATVRRQPEFQAQLCRQRSCQVGESQGGGERGTLSVLARRSPAEDPTPPRVEL